MHIIVVVKTHPYEKSSTLFCFAFILIILSCSHKSYTTSYFDQQTLHHKIVAVLPAEMIFTGKQPENLTLQDISKIEEQESRNFQQSLYNSILRYATSKKY